MLLLLTLFPFYYIYAIINRIDFLISLFCMFVAMVKKNNCYFYIICIWTFYLTTLLNMCLLVLMLVCFSEFLRIFYICVHVTYKQRE